MRQHSKHRIPIVAILNVRFFFKSVGQILFCQSGLLNLTTFENVIIPCDEWTWLNSKFRTKWNNNERETTEMQNGLVWGEYRKYHRPNFQLHQRSSGRNSKWRHRRNCWSLQQARWKRKNILFLFILSVIWIRFYKFTFLKYDRR